MRGQLLLILLSTLFRFSPGEKLAAQGGNSSLWSCLKGEDLCGASSSYSACCADHCCINGVCKACQEKDNQILKSASLIGNLFTDFAGREFTFSGEKNQVYSLITEADHQVNALLDPERWQHREVGATFRGVGIHGPDTRVHIHITSENLLSVSVNERVFRGPLLRLDGVTIRTGCPEYSCGGLKIEGNAVHLSDRFMSLWAWIVAGGKASVSALNVRVVLHNRPMSQVHGILGQSLELEGSFISAAPTTKVAIPANRQFYGEGQISDYSTTDLFSSDSTFSMFTRKAERRRHRRKRQMLEGNALASMAFASKSSVTQLNQIKQRFGG